MDTSLYSDPCTGEQPNLEADVIIGLKEVLGSDTGRELVAPLAQVPVLKGERPPGHLVSRQGDAVGVGG